MGQLRVLSDKENRRRVQQGRGLLIVSGFIAAVAESEGGFPPTGRKTEVGFKLLQAASTQPIPTSC